MTQPAPFSAAFADLVPNWRKPYVVVHVTTEAGCDAFAHYACAMTDHDFVNLVHRGALLPATLRALVRGAAYVLTDRRALAALATEQGRGTLTIPPNDQVEPTRQNGNEPR